uniref:Uncharacterized protein n=1 Tax=Arundo donax TaxID=35708 RepID=A0A0A9DNL9_ARUDO
MTEGTDTHCALGKLMASCADSKSCIMYIFSLWMISFIRLPLTVAVTDHSFCKFS